MNAYPVFALAAAVLIAAAPASADSPARPLQPADRSSPRATLKRFLETGDALTQFAADVHVREQTRQGFEHLAALGDDAVR